jgi:chemotaxis protein methyltransferase CheR
MSGAVEVSRFRMVLARRLGWSFDDNDTGQLAQVLTRRAAAAGTDRSSYVTRLGGGEAWEAEMTALAEELTINETYFFRHGEQFRALAEAVMPERIEARSSQRVLRMLSVGCSSGEEAYTLAIEALRAVPGPDWIVQVLGLDASPAVLQRAAAARYSAWSLRETPDAIRQRWFRPADGLYELDPKARAAVRFRRYNVADEDPALWAHGQYDVVFCRNLLMYLTTEVQASLIRRMTLSLDTGGCLFLGHTDSLGSRPEGLEPLHTHRTFYYRRTGALSPAPPPRAVVEPPALVPLGATTSRRAEAAVGTRHTGTYDGGLALLREERFAAALSLVEAGLEAVPAARELLLYSVLLSQAGRLRDAEEACRRLLDTDGLYADAHHQLGVCHEGAGTVEAALEAYRLAAYLDPDFAMPRLRLGLLARRRGDNAKAGPELERALILLRQEREERIVLFGGGFGRIALTTLCRSELDACRARR